MSLSKHRRKIVAVSTLNYYFSFLNVTYMNFFLVKSTGFYKLFKQLFHHSKNTKRNRVLNILCKSIRISGGVNSFTQLLYHFEIAKKKKESKVLYTFQALKEM